MTSNIDDSRLGRLKQRIGYNAEPVRRPTFKRRAWRSEAGDLLVRAICGRRTGHRLEYAPEEVPEARVLAAMGRGGDTELAHLTLGEIVLPAAMQTPEVMLELNLAAARTGISLDRFRIGMPQNSINPGTGVAEFGILGDVGHAAGNVLSNILPNDRDDANREHNWYGNWCGPGGSENTLNDLDAACKIHDECYDKNGLTALSNFSQYMAPDRRRALEACNQSLCDSAQVSSSPGAVAVNGYFSRFPTMGFCRPYQR